MAEIIFEDAECFECGEAIPKLSLAVKLDGGDKTVYACVECNNQVEADWAAFIEQSLLTGDY